MGIHHAPTQCPPFNHPVRRAGSFPQSLFSPASPAFPLVSRNTDCWTWKLAFPWVSLPTEPYWRGAHHILPWLLPILSTRALTFSTAKFMVFPLKIIFSFVFFINVESPAKTPVPRALCGSIPLSPSGTWASHPPPPPPFPPLLLFRWPTDWKRAAPLFLPTPQLSPPISALLGHTMALL